MDKPRRQKFVRNEAVNPLKLQPRDTALLSNVGEFRFLNTEQLLSLHEGSRRNIVQRLSLLYHHGYLDRPKVQKPKQLPSSHTVYSLALKGADELAEDRGERERILRGVREAQRTKALIPHALMISQFRVCLQLALKNKPDIELTRWVQGDDLKVRLQRRGGNPPLVPDAFFTLETYNWKHHCFLEADRATMPEARFVNKLRMYWRHSRDEAFEKSLGISDFRVLTITPNEKRAEKLCRGAKEADDKEIGSNMYLFLSETAYSLAKPEPVLEPIWASPKNEKHGIVE